MLFNVQSAYTLLKSTIKIQDYVTQAKKMGYTALALADEEVLSGALAFYNACMAVQIKPMIGMKVSLSGLTQPDLTFPLLVYAKNHQGFLTLIELSRVLSDSTLRTKAWQVLEQGGEDLIVISAGKQGELEQALIHQAEQDAKRILTQWRTIFGEDVYIGLPIYPYNPLELNQLIVFANQHQLPLVSNQLVNTLHSQDIAALKVLEAIERKTIIDVPLNEMQGVHYLYEWDHLLEMYQQAGVTRLDEGTQKLLASVQLELPQQLNLLPKFQVPAGYEADGYLALLCQQALSHKQLADQPLYQQRLTHELNVIQKMGFADYFLIVWDIMNFCHQQAIRTGPGRGSAAGSLVSFLLEITLVDPIRYELLFERFLNPERYNMPDIDIDIPDNKRDKVLSFVEQRYGHQQVAQICTFATFGAKQALRDTLRVLAYDSKVLKQWSSAIPNSLNISLTEAYMNSPALKQLVQASQANQFIFEIAQTLEGLPRQISTHAAAVVINDQPLKHYVPVSERPQHLLMTQYTMYDIERVGLLKMDFLGLRNLKILDDILHLINRQAPEFDINQIDMNDQATLQLFQTADTNGVFQFESEGIKQVLRRLKPESFEDIVAVNALFRPGPMKQIDHFIKRRHQQETYTYLHPSLEPILAKTYGIIVYQEQVMQVCQQLAGFSLGQADLLRRAMGKKQEAVMAQERLHFVEGAVNNGLTTVLAEQIYDYIFEFASYGFNRSHAVVYSTLAYQLAYLKAHYPLAFYQVILNSGRSNRMNFNEYMQEAKYVLGHLRPLDINHSVMAFSQYDNKLLVGFDSVRSLKKELGEAIITERHYNGPFTSFIDFLRRLPQKWLKVEQISPLIEVGAFDSLGENRATLVHNLPALIKSIQYSGHNYNLFNDLEPKIEPQAEWSLIERVNREKVYLDFALSGHPVDAYLNKIRQEGWMQVNQLAHCQVKTTITTIALLSQLKVIHTKHNELMAFVSLEDGYGQVEGILFPAVYQKYHHLLSQNQILTVAGKIDMNQKQERQLIIQHLSLPTNGEAEAGDNKQPQRYFIKIDHWASAQEQIAQLKQLSLQYSGEMALILVDKQRKTYQLDATFNLAYNQQVIQVIRELFGFTNVAFK